MPYSLPQNNGRQLSPDQSAANTTLPISMRNLSVNRQFLNNDRNQSLANHPEGVFNPSTPPVSRQRRHSKLHLRIASELSVDQGESSSYASFRAGNDSGSSASNVPPNTKITKDRYKIVMLGSSEVGKTAIVEQFLYGSFPEKYCATVEELHKGEYEIATGGFIPLEILDTSGSFEFPAMRRLAIATGDAFALVYSIDNQQSFEEVKNIREMILQVKSNEQIMPPIVVVGNKTDLPDEVRQVKLELAECECIDWEHGFVECSAKNNHNIINIFSCMLIQARLKGTLNVNQISHPSRHIGAKDHSSELSRAQQRRRSSLPVAELISRFPISPRHEARQSGSRMASSFRKRNSCTPS